MGELVERLVDVLYPPHDPGAKIYRDGALKSANATSGMLRLVEEHATAFGRDYLDKRLLEFVPDLSFEPGPLHEMLQSAPGVMCSPPTGTRCLSGARVGYLVCMRPRPPAELE